MEKGRETRMKKEKRKNREWGERKWAKRSKQVKESGGEKYKGKGERERGRGKGREERRVREIWKMKIMMRKKRKT